MRLGDTPVPIPNTMVKTQSADGTIPETVWESRWMPVHCFLSEDERKRSLNLENKILKHNYRLYHIPLERMRDIEVRIFKSVWLMKSKPIMYLENCIPNEKLYKYFIIRHPRY